MIETDGLPLNRKGASQYLKEKHGIQRSPATLSKLAVIGGGPRFRKDGRTPLYPIEELDAWAAKKLSPVVGSTSELREMAAA